MSCTVVTEINTIQTKGIAWLAVFKKVRFTDFSRNKHIVIEIYKMFRQALYSMHIQFYCMRTECRKIFFGDIVFVIDYMQFRVACIKPFRKMSPCDKMNFIYPRGIFFHSPEPVLQIIPITKSYGSCTVCHC